MFREAYRFGYDMAHHERFHNTDWEMARTGLQREWERQHIDQIWGDFEGAIHHGWLTGRERKM
jgi:hypothetical protein